MNKIYRPMLPITPEELAAIPRARATRLSHGPDGSRSNVWITEASYFGWSVVTDYGHQGVEAVVTSPRNREDCISALADYVRNGGYTLLVDEWEVVSVRHDAWIQHVHDMRSTWAPLPTW